MPARPFKPCRHAGCGALTQARHGYCDAHKHTGWEEHQQGKSRHERGYGAAWDKLRRLVLRRDKYLCQGHRRQGKAVPAHDVDHIVNKASSGTDDLSNLEALCKSCHAKKTAKERQNG